MNPAPPDVIHFTCQSCGMALTVPIQMAGVTGPCPGCQATITSPQAAPRQSAFIQQPVVQSPPVAPIPPSLEALLQGGPLPSQAAAPTLSYQSATSLPPPGSSWPPAPTVHHQPSSMGAMGSNTLPQNPVNKPQNGLPGNNNNTLQGFSSSPQQITPPGQVNYNQYPPISEPPRRTRANSTTSKRGGAFAMAMLMILLALGGTAFFFQDTLKGLWRQYTLSQQEEEDTGDNVNPSIEEVRAKLQANEAKKKAAGDKSTSPQSEAPTSPPTKEDSPKASSAQPAPAPAPTDTSIPSAPPSSSPSTEESIVIKPAEIASAMVDDSLHPGSLVEVPASTSDKFRPETENLTPASSNSIKPAIYEEAPPEAKPAVDALKKFFEAKTWQERVQLVQWPDQMSALMEQYYRTNPDGPIDVTHIQLIPRNKNAGEEDIHPHSVFQVAGGAFKQPMPVMVELTAGGWKVDWLTFIEFKDELLKKFSDNFVNDPARFHVLVRRTHYFDDDIPQLDRKICYELQPPVPGFTTYAFATKGSPLAQQLDRSLGWDVASAAVVVELQWKRQDAYQWLEITAIPQYNWRTPDPVAPSSVPAATAPPAQAK